MRSFQGCNTHDGGTDCLIDSFEGEHTTAQVFVFAIGVKERTAERQKFGAWIFAENMVQKIQSLKNRVRDGSLARKPRVKDRKIDCFGWSHNEAERIVCSASRTPLLSIEVDQDIDALGVVVDRPVSRLVACYFGTVV